MTEEKVSSIEFDPHGDVTFELFCPDGRVQLLVSSRVLTLASPVFAAMFASQSREGLSNHTVLSGRPIPLPDEDEPVFLIFCAASHYKRTRFLRSSLWHASKTLESSVISTAARKLSRSGARCGRRRRSNISRSKPFRSPYLQSTF